MLSRSELITETAKFARVHGPQKAIACTLTLKQRVDNQSIDHQIASQNFRHFLNRLNRHCFGNAAKRFDKKLAVISVIENNSSTRLHIHCSIELPDRYSFDDFCQIIRNLWTETKWGYTHIHFDEVRNDGWSYYLTKAHQKQDYDLSIDWMNFQPANR